MRVLIVGAKGQLGQEVVQFMRTQGTHEIVALDKQKLDITLYPDVMNTVSTIKPDVIINCAAYTAVDQAELHPETARAINTDASRNVAMAAKAVGSKLCFVSTDYVFDGVALTPYKETDQTNPINVYGMTKLAGEQEVKSILNDYFIVRTSWLYGEYGTNFVKSMLKLASERDSIKVVNDQVGSPTYAKDLALFISNLIRTEKYGIYHTSNTGQCTWYEFAKKIFEIKGIKHLEVIPCTTDEYPQLAKRPKFSVMENAAMKINGFSQMRHWEEALEDSWIN
ncbi:dTDP-4-dehydrorhamnose reductase [Paenibacillus albiflavus]|uniref:dTDP-4-dehydrorhamnose reductase n=1 Tax=Paenibacillus albiflavus TaxID=2545760 RepID=A0A4R4EF83_9BACL|nr:dTDP-4-dehydrorhamnose reductase [Paenibacillus albiflavus]TCZ76851.1 dTDP-4-dehydrorhamnose reductase [Paenibacillus albiflavus]